VPSAELQEGVPSLRRTALGECLLRECLLGKGRGITIAENLDFNHRRSIP
jgi:hypothetical protein